MVSYKASLNLRTERKKLKSKIHPNIRAVKKKVKELDLKI